MAIKRTAPTEPCSKINRVVRVAVGTNFNCTVKEWKQLHKMDVEYPSSEFFVNCNIRTPRLATINDHPFKAVITANPELKVDSRLVQRLYTVDQEKVAFIRVKYIPEFKGHMPLITKLAKEGYPVVITPQRFNGYEGLNQYTEKKHYKWSCNRFRLTEEALQDLCDFADSFIDEQVLVCDRTGAGCGGCRLCSFLPTGKDLKIASVDLTSSGYCRYHCPDCYAQTMQRMSRAFGLRPIIFDKIKANTKQAGRSAHAKEVMRDANSKS